jgi:hypothetical protein
MSHNIERPLWTLTIDERRILLITFVGGLGSIVIGACILGGAVALARYVEKTPGSLSDVVMVTVYGAFGTGVYGWGFLQVRRGKLLSGLQVSKFTRSALTILFFGSTVGCALALTLALLAWVGLAAGVK